MSLRAILFDTSAYSAYKNGDERVLECIARADRVYMTVFVLGELFYGFEGGSRAVENRKELDAFLGKQTVRFMATTRETAEVFCSVKHNLKQQGTPLPINDVWIAAHCIELGAVLLSFDKHFLEIPGLRVWQHLNRI